MSAVRLAVPRTPLLLVVLALVLYLPGAWWGAPIATGPERIHGWAVDDETPLGPLAQVNNILHPQEVQNLGYPLLHSFLVVGAYAPYLGWMRVSGRWAGPQGGEFPYGFRDPVGALRTLSLIGHLVSIVMALFVILGAWWAAREIWDDRTGVMAALLTMVSYPMFYYSRTGNVDVPMMAFAAIAMAAYARALQVAMSTRVAVILGAAVGAALATKEQALGLFLAMAPVLLVVHLRREWRAGRRGPIAWKTPMLALAVALLAFGLGSGLLVDPTRFFAHLAHAQERMELARSGALTFIPTYPRTWDGHLDLALLLGGFMAQAMTLPGLALAGVGIALVAWRDRRSLLLLLPAVSYLALLYFATRTGQLRYLMPATFVLGLFAARAVILAGESRHRTLRLAGVASAALVLGLGLLRGVDLTWAMVKDSRHAAAAWIAAEARPGDRLEYFGSAYKLPALPEHLTVAVATPHRGPLVALRRDDAAAAEIAAGWRDRQPRFILVAPDWSSQGNEPHSGSLPPQLFAQLDRGELGYRLAATFQSPALLPWVRRPALDYPMVNIPVRVFVRVGGTQP